jgi:GalNAc-alpha-(1->4)-GalNAc-alpha-(1->3)-diNAcBac-PP-undecaprenol alpha-1,4-N-acetyl-D-galactosaminyltransferase
MGKHNKRKILFTIPTLQAGGAERVLTTLLNYWAKHDTIDIILLVQGSRSQIFYDLNPSIRLIYGGCWSPYTKVFSFFSTYWWIKKVKPDMVISFILWNNILTSFAAKLSRIPCIVAERTMPQFIKNSFIEWVRRKTYLWAQRIIVQTERGRSMFDPKLANIATVVPNPIDIPKKLSLQQENQIVSAGRLAEEKQFENLIKAFSILHKNYPNWSLTIWGEGPERSSLEHLIQQEGLEKSVLLPGATQQLFDEMAKASIFVLSSRFEGMPNALCEAMGLGLAVVATDCLTGPRELIDDGQDGFLVPVGDVDAMAKVIETLITDESLRKAFGKKAATKMKHYDIKTIADLWEGEWERVLGKKKECVD